jgi:hypothetical protein
MRPPYRDLEGAPLASLIAGHEKLSITPVSANSHQNEGTPEWT